MTREFSRNIKSKGIIISETTSWGWHGIKQPSGKHNTINILLTRGARVLGEYSVEVAVPTVNLLLSGSGGSTPHSPIISSEYEIWGSCPRCKKQSACGLPVQIRWKSTQGRVEKRNLARFISLRTAVQIRLLQLIWSELCCLYTGGLWFGWIYLMRKGYCLSCCLVSGPKSMMECSSVVEQWPCKLCVAGSIPAFPIPYSGGIRRRYCGSIGLNPQLRWP